MGIKGLGTFLKKYNKQLVLSTLSCKRIAIDASIFMYKFKYMSDSSEFINKFRFQIKKFKINSITPIYVFDGKSPELKQKLKESRKLVKTITLTKEDINSLKELLNENGVEFVTAPGEGEKFCAYLNNKNYVDYVMSNDYDTLLFNCKNLITYSNLQFHYINTTEVLSDLGISLNQLIDIGISSGCDYYPTGVKGLGVKKSLELSKNHPTDFFDNVTIDFNVNEIRNLFTDFIEEEQLYVSLQVITGITL